jgi:phosphatidylserine/phosphatidylglycerophosphate/cardiolipin synthase-like enzyme
VSFAAATMPAFEAALAGARDVRLSAYVLGRASAVTRELEAAADRGARVAVRLDGAPASGSQRRDDRVARENAATVAALRAHGIDARLTDGSLYDLHLKAAVVDGCAYLDDRNWTPTDSLITTRDAPDVACVEAAIAGSITQTPDLAMTKAAAIAREAAFIAASPADRIDCASESFGATSVSKALAARAVAGSHVRLVVSSAALAPGASQERAALTRLAAAGVEIRVANEADKVCVGGQSAWVGSANATFSPGPPMIDWGLTTNDAAIVRAAAATFARDWERGRTIDSARLIALSG